MEGKTARLKRASSRTCEQAITGQARTTRVHTTRTTSRRPPWVSWRRGPWPQSPRSSPQQPRELRRRVESDEQALEGAVRAFGFIVKAHFRSVRNSMQVDLILLMMGAWSCHNVAPCVSLSGRDLPEPPVQLFLTASCTGTSTTCRYTDWNRFTATCAWCTRRNTSITPRAYLTSESRIAT